MQRKENDIWGQLGHEHKGLGQVSGALADGSSNRKLGIGAFCVESIPPPFRDVGMCVHTQVCARTYAVSGVRCCTRESV